LLCHHQFVSHDWREGDIALKCAHRQKVPFYFFPEQVYCRTFAQHDDGIDLAVRDPSGVSYAFIFPAEMPA
jgi:hypothetical protein